MVLSHPSLEKTGFLLYPTRKSPHTGSLPPPLQLRSQQGGGTYGSINTRCQCFLEDLYGFECLAGVTILCLAVKLSKCYKKTVFKVCHASKENKVAFVGCWILS